jgi:Xaa-Pro aminopeptidase
MSQSKNRAVSTGSPGRLRAVRQALKERELDCLLVASRENVRYLLGFTGSSGWALVSADDAVLATDSRYVDQAHAQVQFGRVRLAEQGLVDFTVRHASENGVRTLGFEADILSFATCRAIESGIAQAGAGCRIAPVQGIVESLRAVKDDSELALIQAAAALADRAFGHACSLLRCGMTEQQLAWQIERWLRENGSGPMPFRVIVASGPNAALPHAEPSERAFGQGEPIVMDLGATSGGYCSDLTRTVFLGEPAGGLGEVYRTVLAAQQEAIRDIRVGMRASDADELARSVLRRAGLDGAFGHGLGHGVGLAIHESPTVSSRSTDVLAEGMVFTVEPGVYLPGQGGVRIEDTVMLRDGVVRPFTHAAKHDPVVVIRQDVCRE